MASPFCALFGGRARVPGQVAAAGLALLVLLIGPARARIWNVTPGGTGDAPTIQAAIDSAATGDTLDISAGFYLESCSIVNKTLLIRGAGAGQTEIGWPDHGHVIRLKGPDNFTEIRDLTLSDGRANSLGDPEGGTYGGGLLAEEAVFALIRCHVLRCSAGGLGGGVYATFQPFIPTGHPAGPPRPAASGADGRGPAVAGRPAIVIEDCLFEGGFAGSEGGGLVLEFTQFLITGCTFRNNFAVQGGGVSILDSIGWIERSLFEGNEALQDGGGVKIDERTNFEVSALLVGDNTFVRNKADRWGSGLVLGQGHGIEVERNLFVDQGGLASAVIGCMTLDVEYKGGCNHFWNNGRPKVADCPPLADDTTGEPFLCGAASGDYRICAASPLLARDCGAAGAFGIGCGGSGCATPTRSTTWSGIKTLFR